MCKILWRQSQYFLKKICEMFNMEDICFPSFVYYYLYCIKIWNNSPLYYLVLGLNYKL